MAIDIAYYLQEIESHMAATIHESEGKQKQQGQLLDEDRLNILLRRSILTAKKLEEEIYHEVKKKEQKSYDYNSNEMNILALAAMLAAWSGWVFKSKSEDPKRPKESREQAAAVSKYVESFIRNAINAGQRLGKDGERPEGKSQLIEID